MSQALTRLAFYASPPHECAYLPEREAVTLFADPYAPMDPEGYDKLLAYGFRRSGKYIYRPRCPDCRACISVRVPVAEFRPDRSQRRTWRANQDLEVIVRDDAYREEHFALYRRYMRHRHPGGGMDVTDPAAYSDFLSCPWGDTRFVEFREEERLLAVAVIDQVPHALSAVYTFFEPETAHRGLGTHAILWQIETARRQGRPWVYLGYWLEESPKMAYKDRFRPLEALQHGVWQRRP